MLIKNNIFKDIMNTIGTINPETGGILGSNDLKTITHFYYDTCGKSTSESYTPDVDTINRVLDYWSDNDIYLVGIIHSHLDVSFPTCMDISYASDILYGLKHLDYFYLPIIADKKMHCYKLIYNENKKIICISTNYTII